MIEITEPAYPLSRAKFNRALMTGHGRALIHAERCGTENVREDILDAALFPRVYDPMCNGHGEAWLARLCEAAGLVESLISQDHGITGDLELRCELLKEFALQGHAAPRAELRELCRYDEEQAWLPAAGEIVEVDGEDGFLFAADRAGETLLKHPAYWGSTYLASLLDEKVGQGRAVALMDQESPRNPNIAAFREAVLKDRHAKEEKRKRPDLALDEVLGLILGSTKSVYKLRRAGEKAARDERKLVAALNFPEMDSIALQNYLGFFQNTGFPELWEEHLSLLGHPEKDVRWHAHATMSNHAEPELRQAAHETLARGEVTHFVMLLKRLGRREDMEPLLEAISRPGAFKDDDDLHSAVLWLLDLMAANRRMRDRRLPLWVYENSPCRRCRHSAVKQMIQRSILPQWVAAECLSDADEETREIAAEHLGVRRIF